MSVFLVPMLTALGYFLAATGCLPSPAYWRSLFHLTSAERFPCEGHSCGCASATECWTHCGCYTDHERLAWAIRNAVDPPDSVTFTDEQWVAAANSVQPGSSHCMLCVSEVKRSADRLAAAQGDRDSCCTSGSSSPPSAGPCCSGAKGHRQRVPVASALSCKRLSWLVGHALPAILLDRGVDIIPPSGCSQPSLRPGSEAAVTRPLDVPDPPPRLAVLFAW